MLNFEVTASVRGNLGPPSVVVSPQVTDWLKDRWQAAKDMSGTPIPGQHWLQLDLSHPANSLTRVLIDYEVALSNDYYIETHCVSTGSWQTVHDTKVTSPKQTKKKKQDKVHYIHDISIKDSSCKLFDKVKLSIRSPATRFGVSVWRLEAHGSFSSQ
jgi:hypothetical protein